MKLKWLTPAFILLLLSLIVLCDVSVFQGFDKADPGALFSLLSMPLYITKYVIYGMLALVYFVLSIVLHDKAKYISNLVFTSFFVGSHTIISFVTGNITGAGIKVSISMFAIWIVGFLIVLCSRHERNKNKNTP
jgi:hypothetical protein